MPNASLLNLRRLTCGAGLLLLLPGVSVGEPSLEGRWIGGFSNHGEIVPVEATFAGQTALTGTIDLPQRAELEIPLHDVRQRGSSVEFEVPGANANMLFEGRFENAGRVQGSVRQGMGYSRFELLRLATLQPADLQGLYGTYEWAPGKVMLIAPGQSQPIYVDYDTGRTGTLFPIGRDELVAGPSVSTGYPVRLRLRANRDAGARATRLQIERGGRTVHATRKQFYAEIDMGYRSGNAQIAGSLLRPSTPGPHPAIVMIHGSGPVTRDVLRPFADHFARNGVAVLLTDKRGSGRSTGQWSRATFDDLAADALAGVQALRARADILPYAVGLHGMSLGGWIAPLAASRSKDVAFVVVESAPAMTPREHERLRVESQMRADGMARERIAQAVAFMDQKFEVSRTGQGWDRLTDAMRAGAREGWLVYVNPPSSLESLRWHWEHVFSYDPLPVLLQLNVPMLVLYGALDAIVPPNVHRARMEQALEAAGKQNVTIREFAKANHGFFEAITGGRQERPNLASFVSGYFEARTAWVRAHALEAANATADMQN